MPCFHTWCKGVSVSVISQRWTTSEIRRAGLTRNFAKRRRGRGGANWIGDGPVSKMTNSELEVLAAELKTEARRLGLGPTAVTSARPSARFAQYEAWLAKNYHGELGYMARDDRVARRRDPQLILPGAQVVVMTTLFYWPGRSGFPPEHDVKPRHETAVSLKEREESRGRLSRGIMSCYAWGDDYHAILEEKLRALGEWLNTRAAGIARYYVDTGAVLERDFAERAGLGFVGKNSLLIHPRAGSGFFIGGLFTTVPLPLDGDEDRGSGVVDKPGQPGCGKCTKCKVACPTGAIVEDRVVDARKCISYLTIELKGSIPVDLRPLMGSRIYGCDICQQVCPWNAFDWQPKVGKVPHRTLSKESSSTSRSGSSPLFGSPGADVTVPRLVELLWETRSSFKRRFQGSAVSRIGHERMARNAAVALGNIGTQADVAAVGAAAIAHPSALVREHAQWAFQQIFFRIRNKAGLE